MPKFTANTRELKTSEANKVLADCPCDWAAFPLFPFRAPNNVVGNGADVVFDMLIEPPSAEARYDQGSRVVTSVYNVQFVDHRVSVTSATRCT